jgi:hypothetical protein
MRMQKYVSISAVISGIGVVAGGIGMIWMNMFLMKIGFSAFIFFFGLMVLFIVKDLTE